MTVAAIAVAALMMQAFPATAGEGCPALSRVEAEQAMRLHSELMVIGLTCQKYYRKPANIYGKYQEFTVENADFLRGAEDGLVASMGAKQFHALRTRIANDASQRAAVMTPMAYCRTNAGFVGEVLALSSEGVRAYVRRLAEGARQQAPGCMALAKRIAVASKK